MTTLAASSKNLAVKQRIQLGSKTKPCAVKYGQSKKYSNAKTTWMGVAPPAGDVTKLDDFDEASTVGPLVKYDQDDGTAYINVKIHRKRTKIIDITGKPMSIDDVDEDDHCIVVGKLTPYTHEGEDGVSFRAMAVMIVEHDEEDSGDVISMFV